MAAADRAVALSDVSTALARCDDTPFDVLLVDMILPEMNGFELAQEIRRRRPEVRVVYMSGYAERALSRLHSSLDGLLIDKPFSPRQLAARVREALDRPQREGSGG